MVRGDRRSDRGMVAYKLNLVVRLEKEEQKLAKLVTKLSYKNDNGLAMYKNGKIGR
jgi:hypothetical protein